MLVVETIARIRREYFVKGKPIKEIVRDVKVSRNTVRKVIRSQATAFTYDRRVQPMPKLGPWTAELERMLEANETKSKRERLTLLRISEALEGLGYGGGYDAVRRYAKAWRWRRSASTAQTYVPLVFSPGEAYQFDWSHEYVVLAGVTTKVKVAHVRLCHSRMFFVRAYPRASQEMVFDAHDRAFRLFQGACRRGIYDNMKTAVQTVLIGKERAFNRRFVQMCGHYLVEPTACTPGAGWEKGQVENQVGIIRGRFFTPRLRFKTYDELNAWLLDQCVAYARRHPHPVFKDRTVWQVFEDERPSPGRLSRAVRRLPRGPGVGVATTWSNRQHARRGAGWEKGQVENQVGIIRGRFFTPRLRFKTYDELNAWLLDQCVAYARRHPHPVFKDRTVWQVFEDERPSLVGYRGPFDGFHAVPASVSKTCLVRFDSNKYSVAARAVGRPVEVHAYADRIVIRQDGEIVAEHARRFGRDQTVYDPWHYVPVLARKPGALRNGAPFKDWALPGALGRVRVRLAGHDDGDRQMVEILTAVLADGLAAVEAACAEALAGGVCSADVVLNILNRRRQPSETAPIPTPANLRLRFEPVADCTRYDRLRGVGHGAP